MSTERKVALSVLKKMGVDFTVKISKDRALKKLVRACDGNALPKDLSDAEQDLLTVLGIKALKANVKANKDAKDAKKKKKDKNEQPEPKTSRKAGALEYFKAQWENKKSWKRAAIVTEMMKKFGDKAQWAAANYISLAKKDKKVLGFLLTEEKSEDGIKTLHRM